MCRPGTYGVVVTPESFSDLPEYAALASPRGRRTSTQSRGHRISTDSPGSSLSRTSTQTDTNFVVLDRFEDATPPAVAQYRVPSPARRPSIPDALQQLSISSPLHSVAPAYPTAAPTRPGNMEDRFIAHFRRYIVRRLVQPLVDRQPHDNIVPGSTRDVFETEATRFPPVCYRTMLMLPLADCNVAASRNVRNQRAQSLLQRSAISGRSFAALPSSFVYSSNS